MPRDVLFSSENLVSLRHKMRNLPVLTTNTWGMLYGALIMLSIVLARGLEFEFDTSPQYLGSLLFLVVPGTLIVFVTYLTLIGEIGVDRAAYSTVLFPIIALSISTVVEGYVWTPLSLLGLTMALVGNVIVFAKFNGLPFATKL